VLDRSGLIRWMNPSAIECFGDQRGRLYVEMFAPETQPIARREFAKKILGTVRASDGDVVCFPVGPEGAHRVHNPSDEAARVALFSNKHEFGIIEYPDSDKIGVWGRHDDALDHVIRRSPDLDYWDGERLEGRRSS